MQRAEFQTTWLKIKKMFLKKQTKKQAKPNLTEKNLKLTSKNKSFGIKQL